MLHIPLQMTEDKNILNMFYEKVNFAAKNKCSYNPFNNSIN